MGTPQLMFRYIALRVPRNIFTLVKTTSQTIRTLLALLPFVFLVVINTQSSRIFKLPEAYSFIVYDFSADCLPIRSLEAVEGRPGVVKAVPVRGAPASHHHQVLVH
jgi:hypothetical protein